MVTIKQNEGNRVRQGSVQVRLATLNENNYYDCARCAITWVQSNRLLLLLQVEANCFRRAKKKRDVDFHSDSLCNDLCRDPISQNGVNKAQLSVSMFLKYRTTGA